MKTKRVLVVGVDGATFNLLDPWINDGSLPNFARIVKDGVSCPLMTTVPPMTGPGWISFSTGKNPGKHGIFDFYKIKNYRRQIIDSRAIKSRQIWDLVSEAKKKVIVINPPISYPVNKVNGCLIGGMLTPSYKVNWTYPPELKNKLLKWGYKIGVELDIGMRSNFARSFVFTQDKRKLRRLVTYFNQIAKKRLEVFERLSQQIDWRFAFILFEGADRLQHYYWKRDRLFIIKEHYQALDKILGKLLRLIGQTGALIVVSDHGFGLVKRKFYINNFLAFHGLLVPKKSNVFWGLILKGGKQGTNLLGKLGLPHEVLLTNRWVFRLYKKLYQPNIDFAKTKAFMLTETSRGIWLNVKGREPQGLISSREYEKIRDFIVKELRKLRDPKTGKQVVEAFKKEEIYRGFYVQQAPDILLITRPGYSLEITIEEATEKLARRAFTKGTSIGERNADHEMRGLLIMFGPDFKKTTQRGRRQGAEIIDITPTVLRLLNLSIPSDLDGKVLGEFLK